MDRCSWDVLLCLVLEKVEIHVCIDQKALLTLAAAAAAADDDDDDDDLSY